MLTTGFGGNRPRMNSNILMILGCLSALSTLGQSTAGQNKTDSPPAVTDSTALFQNYCAYCHGTHGEGGRGADLTTGEYQHGSSDSDLFATIRYGVRGTEMPATGVNDEEATKLVAFIKTIASSGTKEVAPGDPAAGKMVYEKSGCVSCHALNKQGNAIGPDLSDVGRRRNLKYLEESIVKPEADIPVQYRAVQVVLKSGQTFNGIRLNEDDISIQIRDMSNNLRSFMKEDVREIRHDKPSLMPSYESAFSRKQLDDVVAYLHSLRGAQ